MIAAGLALKRYRDFGGRSGRLEFWSFAGLNFAVLLAAIVLTFWFGSRPSAIGADELSPFWVVIYLAWWTATAIPWFAVQVRRFHDLGLTGWFVLANVAAYPVIALHEGTGLALFTLSMLAMVVPGSKHANRYGEALGDHPANSADDFNAHAFDRERSTLNVSIAVKPSPSVQTEADPTDPEIEELKDGRFRCFGREFSLRAEAVRYAQYRRETNRPFSIPGTAHRVMTKPAKERDFPVGFAIPDPGTRRVQESEPVMELQPLEDDDVVATGDGRFMAFGYSFSSRLQARRFAEKRRRKANRDFTLALAKDVEAPSKPVSKAIDTRAAVPSPPSPRHHVSVLARQEGKEMVEGDDGIEETADGRYSVAGYAFSTRLQAVLFAKRRRDPLASDVRRKVLPGQGGIDASSTGGGPVDILQPIPDQGEHSPLHPEGVDPDHTNDPPGEPENELADSEGNDNGVIAAADGRFVYKGYSFSTSAQAEDFRSRRERRKQPREGTVAPRQELGASRPAAVTQRKTAASSPRKTAQPRWIDAPQQIRVAETDIEVAMVYHGTSSASTPHRSLIDPRLPVASIAETGPADLGFWPSYAEMLPQQRRRYLEWIGSDRRDPAMPIGYVFVYFYGLEHRLLAGKAAAEAPAIMDEVKALVAAYGPEQSFAHYAHKFMASAEVILGLRVQEPVPDLGLSSGWEIPINLRIHLGRKIEAGQPIDADDALCWALGHPNLPMRMPVTRCFEEFCTLWRVRFHEAHPKGIKVRTVKTRLAFEYRAASHEFTASAPLGDLPDIAAMSGPISKLDALLQTCTEALDPMSRLLGRSPDERGSILAVTMCPPEARGSAASDHLQAIRADLLARSQDQGRGLLNHDEIISTLIGVTDASPERQVIYTKRLPAILDALELGHEPDKRHGASQALSQTNPVAIFDATSPLRPAEGRGAFVLGRVLVELAICAATCEGKVGDGELRSIALDLAGLSELDNADLDRLMAYARALATNPPTLKPVVKRIEKLASHEQDLVFAAGIHAILADGNAAPGEVRFLEKLYVALGRPQQAVYSDLHARAAAPLASVRVDANRSSAGAIDEARLARIRQDTHSVSSMLAAIFVEDEADNDRACTELANGPLASANGTVAGLDGTHSAIVLQLVREPMHREAFDAACREQRLLPAGAIEKINDWAFDLLDDIAIEDEETISIPASLIKMIEDMSARA